jgi:hypothetical protein
MISATTITHYYKIRQLLMANPSNTLILQHGETREIRLVTISHTMVTKKCVDSNLHIWQNIWDYSSEAYRLWSKLPSSKGLTYSAVDLRSRSIPTSKMCQTGKSHTRCFEISWRRASAFLLICDNRHGKDGRWLQP